MLSYYLGILGHTLRNWDANHHPSLSNNNDDPRRCIRVDHLQCGMNPSSGNLRMKEAPAAEFSYTYNSTDEEENSVDSEKSDNSTPLDDEDHHFRFQRSKRHKTNLGTTNHLAKFIGSSREPPNEDGEASEESSSSQSENSTSTNSSPHSNLFTRHLHNRTNRSTLQQSTPGQNSEILRHGRRKAKGISVLRFVLIKMIQFSSKYHKEISIILFLIATALSLVKKG